MTARARLVAAGFALTALTYGLARFAYGLLLPDIRTELGLSAQAAGSIGGLAFAAYCLGVMAAFYLRAILSDRSIAISAALIGCAGLAGTGLASGVPTLGLSTVLCGLSTGLTSPALASLVGQLVAAPERTHANGAINAGTAAGIILSAASASLMAEGWRILYALYAALGAAVTLWLLVAIPDSRGEPPRAGSPAFSRPPAAALLPLCASALLMGCGSTAIWTFGASILREAAGLSDGRIALAWGTLGLAGLFGAAAGALTDRFGIAPVHRAALAIIAAGIAALNLVPGLPGLDLIIMGAFGFAYILSSGSLLLWGIALFHERPDHGLGIAFLAIALGQAVGAPLFGILSQASGRPAALLCAAGLMIVAMAWRVPLARQAPPASLP